MSIICPHCFREFNDEPLEELVNPTLTITRKRIETGTWQDIAGLIKNGYAYRAISEGDTISCKLKDGKDILIDVVGIDVYGNNEAIFCFHDLYCKAKMNDEATNRGGFCNSKLYTDTLMSVWNNLPDDLRDVITPRKIKQGLSEGGMSEGFANLWLPSSYEVFGDIHSDSNVEDDAVRFPIFQKVNQRIRSLVGEEEGSAWWLRDFSDYDSLSFCFVDGYGYLNSYLALGSLGVLPCFKIS